MIQYRAKNQTNQLKSWITHYKRLCEESHISAAMVTAPTLIGGDVFRIVGYVVFKMELNITCGFWGSI